MEVREKLVNVKIIVVIKKISMTYPKVHISKEKIEKIILIIDLGLLKQAEVDY